MNNSINCPPTPQALKEYEVKLPVEYWRGKAIRAGFSVRARSLSKAAVAASEYLYGDLPEGATITERA